MKSILLLLLLFSPKVDSLLSVSMDTKLDDKTRAEAFLGLSNLYSEKDQIDSTQLFAEKALALAQKIEDREMVMKAYFRIGNSQALKTQYEESSKTFFKALRIAEDLGDKQQQALIIKEIGYVFMYTGNKPKAIEYFNKMYDLFIELGDKQKAAYTLGSIGTVYYTDSNNVEAVKYFERGLQIAKELQDERVLQFLYSNVGLAYFWKGERQKGTDYVLKSKALAQKLGSRYHEGIDLVNLSHFAEMSNNLPLALKYGLEAEPILRELGLKNPLKSILSNLHVVYQKLGNYPKAYEYQAKFYELKSEIDAENSKKEAEIQELEYDAEKDQLQIENLNKDLENRRLQQILLFGGIVVLLAVGGVLWWTNKSLSKKNSLIAEQNAEIEAFNKDLEQKVAERTAELQEAYDEIKEAMTKGQTLERKRIASDLHDNLGSVISAINFSLSGISRENLSENQKSIYDNVVQMTDSAYSELRNLSHNLLPERLEKEGLVSAIAHYLESLNAAQPVWFDFTTNTQERFSKKIEMNLYAVVLECCNNILKHAKATEASIEITVHEESLQLSIQDDGVGFDPSNTNGKGLSSMRERLKEVNGEVTLQTKGEGTKVEFLIPILS